MGYFCYSSSLNVCNYCPFGFLLVMFPLGSSFFRFSVSFPLKSLMGGVG